MYAVVTLSSSMMLAKYTSSSNTWSNAGSLIVACNSKRAVLSGNRIHVILRSRRSKKINCNHCKQKLSYYVLFRHNFVSKIVQYATIPSLRELFTFIQFIADTSEFN